MRGFSQGWPRNDPQRHLSVGVDDAQNEHKRYHKVSPKYGCMAHTSSPNEVLLKNIRFTCVVLSLAERVRGAAERHQLEDQLA